MKMQLKPSALLALLLLLILALTSCTTGTQNPEGNSTEPPESEQPSTEETSGEGTVTEEGTGGSDAPEVPAVFDIVKDGESKISIIRPEEGTGTEMMKDMAVRIRAEITELTGVSPRIADDFVRKGSEHNSDTYEILVGHTNYKETQSAMNTISYGNSVITVVGHKIIVSGWADSAIEQAASDFIDLLKANVKDNNISLKTEDIQSSKQIVKTVNKVPVIENAYLDSISDCHDNAYLLLFEDSSVDIFNAYTAKLESENFTEYNAHTLGNVSFATYYNNEQILNVWFESSDNDLRVITEPYQKDQLPPKETTYQKVCEPALLQVGTELDHSSSKPAKDSQNGECYIWLLEDGTFIILDGGFNYTVGAQQIYNGLKELAKQTPTPDKITVSCWIFSHMHGDHNGAARKFVASRYRDVDVKSFMYNTPTSEQSAIQGGGTYSGYEDLRSKAKTAYPNAVHYKAQVGEVYHFAGAEITIFYSLEMYAPTDLAYYNTCSIVFRISFGTFDMMMLGDCSEPSNKIMRENYGKALECEVVQVAHHGYQGGSTELYRLINPIHVLWPTGSIHYSSCANSASGNSGDRNGYFFMNNTRIDAIYVAFDDVWYFDIVKDTGFKNAKNYINMKEYQSRVA